MATHSSTVAWKIPWMEVPGRLQSMGLQRVIQNRATLLPISEAGLIQPAECCYLVLLGGGRRGERREERGGRKATHGSRPCQSPLAGRSEKAVLFPTPQSGNFSSFNLLLRVWTVRPSNTSLPPFSHHQTHPPHAHTRMHTHAHCPGFPIHTGSPASWPNSWGSENSWGSQNPSSTAGVLQAGICA